MDITDQLLRLLLEQLIEEILSRLPVRTLLEFRIVSKSWRSLIDRKRFIKSHLQNSKRKSVLVESTIFNYYILEPYSPHPLLKCDELAVITPSPSDFDVHSGILLIAGSLNGPVCILTWNLTIFFWNPSTRTFWKLPCINPLIIGFGWEESSDEYKVFAIHRDELVPEYTTTGKVYSWKTNSWRTLNLPHPHRKFCGNPYASQLLHGKLHWNRLARNIRRIVSFDLKMEVFGEIEALYCVYEHFIEPGVLEGCLCILSYSSGQFSNVVDVWVMKQYGVTKSWVKMVALSQVFEVVRPPFSASVTVGSDGEILLFSPSTFLLYSSETNLFRRFF